MLKHTLVPLDGSALAEEALKYAVEITDPLGEITLMSAVELPEIMPGGFYPIVDPALVGAAYNEHKDKAYSAEEVVTQVKVYLEHTAEQLGERTVSTHVEISEPAALILKLAEERKVDAIVISTHGRSGLSRWLFGSVTQRVLNHALVPVFVVRSTAQAAKPEQSSNADVHYG
jgi:nucleotide-binding universal stress UspA family protein